MYLPGCRFTSATHSAIVRAGNDGCTQRKKLVAPSRAIGVNSVSGSMPGLDTSCGAMLSVVTVGISSV